jgi:hypothetical protein
MIALRYRKRSREGGQPLVAPKVAPVIPFIIVPDMRKGSEGLVCATARLSREFAGVAQPVEHLICNQRVGGSNPFASSTERSSDEDRIVRQAADSVSGEQVFPTHSIRNFSGL